MKANDRARLTTALRDHVAKIAADLRAKMRAPGAARVAAEQLHKDERVAEDFEVWTDLLSRRAAVLWVLKSVYVRVLEDRGLLAPGRLLDPEAQQLFEKLAPNLGETAFLRWIYKDLAGSRGGVPELFSPQPAEVALPSDELSRALIAFWRHRDADSGAVWSFAEEHFEGELMGDLYQELDPVVKDRFALCQTPDFVRAFILDRTLTPAIETFGADEVRLLDPACGSGHFLIDGLKRLVVATAAKHADWDRAKVVAHALDRVVGVDLNDYACALARTRLIMTAAELAGVTKLADAARFHPHVYWADGLEQVEREEQKAMVQTDLFTHVQERPRATFTRSDVRVALRKVFEKKFHAVVANPPYIAESDESRATYHREKVGRRRRYVSAYREYTLSSVFVERSLQLLVSAGFLGVIIENAFMKWPRGKPLIEDVLASVDLSTVVDCSQAYIPHHGTQTVLLLAQRRAPGTSTIRVVMGKRGELGTPAIPALGAVWTSIVDGVDKPGFENEYISVADAPRERFSKYPWSLGGGGKSDLRSELEARAPQRVANIAMEVGLVSATRADDIYFVTEDAARRLRIPDEQMVDNVGGDRIRDWAISGVSSAIFPYDANFEPVTEQTAPAVHRYLWGYRTLLWLRRELGGNHRELGLTWWEWSRFQRERYTSKLLITFAGVATHNHFVLNRTRRSFDNRSAPVIRLPSTVDEDAHLALLALLNSSTTCFWMKQVFQPKSHSGQRHHPDPERASFDIGSTGIGQIPVPALREHASEIVALARIAEAAMGERADVLAPNYWADSLRDASALRERLRKRWTRADATRQRAIFAQEEIDWLVYHLFGLVDRWLRAPRTGCGMLPRGQRAFERVKGHRSFIRRQGALLPPEQAEVETGSTALAPEYEAITEERAALIRQDPTIGLLESHVFKRLWRDTEDNIAEGDFRRRHDLGQLREWLLTRIEEVVRNANRPTTASRIAAAIQDDRRVLAVAEVYCGQPSFDLLALVSELLAYDSVPNHPFHLFTESGLKKHRAWEAMWDAQRREDAGEVVGTLSPAPTYSQGSRGKSKDFVRTEYWRIRGPLDVPRERFAAFTEVPGRGGVETLCGWAGWLPSQRLRAILAIDEELEDAGVVLADRIGLLDSAWRLLPDVAREDAASATRLKAELQALVGPEGPSRELMEDWKKRFPPPTTRTARAKKAAAARDDDDSDIEESAES